MTLSRVGIVLAHVLLAYRHHHKHDDHYSVPTKTTLDVNEALEKCLCVNLGFGAAYKLCCLAKLGTNSSQRDLAVKQSMR